MKNIENWVSEIAELTKPDNIRWIDGSEQDEMNQLLVERGTFTQLNPEKRPNSFLARTNPADVARVEERTFICLILERSVRLSGFLITIPRLAPLPALTTKE
jgi:phosphoenolpyruvate carboxykinase (GTP)